MAGGVTSLPFRHFIMLPARSGNSYSTLRVPLVSGGQVCAHPCDSVREVRLLQVRVDADHLVHSALRQQKVSSTSVSLQAGV